MKKLLLVTFLGTFCYTNQALAWFIFIPGSVTSAISDAITGDKGEHCVTRGAKPGDIVTDVAGGRWRVENISGESMRCASDKPIRATLAPIGSQVANSTPQESSHSSLNKSPQLGSFTPDLGNSWSPKPVYPHMREKLIQGYYIHESNEWELVYGSLTRSSLGVSVQKYADSVHTAIPGSLENTVQTEISVSSDHPKSIYHFEREGNLSNGSRVRYFISVFAYDGDLVLLQQFAKAELYSKYNDKMKEVSSKLAGVTPSVQTTTPGTSGAYEEKVIVRPSLNSSAEGETLPKKGINAVSSGTAKPSSPVASNTEGDNDSGSRLRNEPEARLTRLKDLHAKGLITKEEFDSKRKAILSEL